MSAYTDVQKKEKAEAIRLLKEQIQVEGRLVGLYEKTTRRSRTGRCATSST